MTASDAVTRERVNAWLEQEFAALATEWLPWQRWFGGKARTIDRVDIEDVIWLPLDTDPCVVVVVDVRYAQVEPQTSSERYAMVISITDDPKGCPTIARLTWRPGLRAIEATAEGLALRALLQGLTTGTPLRGNRGGVIVYADATTSTTRLLAGGTEGPPSVVAVGLEQSNTSVRVGASHAFKLFRRLESGENPQLEIGWFLMRTAFRSVPALEGSLVYRGPGGESCALGVLEKWVDNQGDGWSYVLAQLDLAHRDATVTGRLHEDLRTLGATTADFHAALASDSTLEAFAPEPVTSLDRCTWLRQARAQATRTFGLVEHHLAEWPEPAAALGRSLLSAKESVAHQLNRIEDEPHERFQKIRTHGDFHLGQTLKTTDGFSIIDFEGEPVKPLSERRQKHCALRDVAGMVRSLDYAAATAQARVPEAGKGSVSVSSLRDAFVDAYRARALTHHVRFLPPTPAAIDGWLRFFEVEKALYEVEYEVNNRPDWIPIPLRAVVRLLTGPTGTNGSAG